MSLSQKRPIAPKKQVLKGPSLPIAIRGRATRATAIVTAIVIAIVIERDRRVNTKAILRAAEQIPMGNHILQELANRLA
jgi:hypothetical protein